uniref:Protein kinase domain-containing protein n=1 Tax=Scophthalmus maximus TaxID=52904 RepID=A0A8D3E5S4_SCOMX
TANQGVLPNASFGYVLVKTLGEGDFGTVHKCVALDTKELVALKIVKKEYAQYGKREVDMLKRLRKLDPHKNNLIMFNRHLLYSETFMLEFEMLDMNIDDLIDSCDRPLHLSEIQVITQQMLVALNALRSIRIVHADIKPDNIMLVNHKLQPLKVKLIDFDLARTVDELKLDKTIQILSYRAPEVLLGLCLNEAVDTWALGCVMADMYLCTDLYTPLCEFDRVKDMVKGVLTWNTSKFTNPEKRIIPSKALLHPFITMKDFPSESKSNPDSSPTLSILL